MQLGSIELQIFVALILVLGSAFVALVCDFLKGNNEQLRERNIELRVRQDERERLGLFEPLAHPITWLQGLAALARNPGLVDKVAGQPASAASQPMAQSPMAAAAAAAPAPVAATASAATVAEPTVEPASAVPGVAELAGGPDRNPQRRHRYDEFKASAKGQTWATKEELEQLAGRAARIRARHEASQKKQEETIGLAKAPSVETPVPVPAPELKPELLRPVRSAPPAADTMAAPVAEPRALPAPIAFPARTEPAAEPALTASELMAGLPPPTRPLEAPLPSTPAPVVPESPMEAESPMLAEPPMVDKPAPAPWSFKPIAEERPRAVEIPAAAASTSMGILKPEAPALVPAIAPPAEVAAVAAEHIEAPVAGPMAIEEEFGEAPLSIFEQPLAELPPAALVSEPAAAEVRTRIHQIEVPALAEATTEDLTPLAAEAPVAAIAEPAAPEVPLWRVPLEEPQPAAAAAEPEVSIWLTPPVVERTASTVSETPLWRQPVEASSEPPAPAPVQVAAASEPPIPLWRTPVEEPVAAAPAPSQAEPEIPLWREPVGPPSGIAIDLEPEELHIPVSRTPQAAPVETTVAALPPVYAPPVDARPVDTDLPGLDVAALQKATGSSRPAVPSVPAAAAEVASSEGKLDLPPGLHESAVLSQLLENQTPFSGVVVAIGLNDFETLREKLAAGNDSVAALSRMVLSMLRAQDFACRFQEDEYILIYPGERGSSAQRRLFQVSEKLWDFQLRSLGNLSVMFSWGGLEVTNETLAEAVASARERMYQTKRNRKPASLDFSVGRKKVVNG